MQELPKSYTPQDVEDKWYQFWESSGFFHASPDSGKKPYTIVIPPPNITGILTMGHVLNNTLQDVFIRWRRMQGYEACWVPGTDHAGIATQHVVEKSLLKEGIVRRELGREQFVQRVWQWKELYGGTIIKQLRKLGTSCDWERERFTMDEGLSNAVQEVFVRLYDKGLIYKGKYIVNWCPKDHTALSDDEVNHSDSNGHLWYIKYPVEGINEFVTVATTRPETMLGDTAVAVNPKDDRYKHLVGKSVLLPIANRIIPIIADDFVDASFGTGAVKVTPAHDPNDYQIGERHNLEKLIVMDTSGKMNEHVPTKYRGMDRYECRKEVIRDLEKKGLLEKIEDHVHSVGHCYRCDTVIEPYLSDQWFVRMKPLAEKALQVVQNGEIKFYPERWTKVYENWMTNIRDWCISRQLWWGHRIPVYYLPDGSMIVARSIEEASAKLKAQNSKFGAENLKQDDDVLDTWFSSWLWPFSVFDWPKEDGDVKYFYPTDTLITAPDIIFFWVARMIMAGLEFRGAVPFKHVYFTSIIRDMQGRKMSKSLGNSPDPLDVITTYGADALRFTILYLAPIGQDVLYSNEKCEMGRNFANKIWNAGRFLLMNRDAIAADAAAEIAIVSAVPSNDLSDAWILSRFNTTVKETTEALENLRVNEAVKMLYDFMWHDFCDWYIEATKPIFNDGNGSSTIPQHHPDEREETRATLARVIETALRALHPFMPFVTEELWQRVPRPSERPVSIALAPYPGANEAFDDVESERLMQAVIDVISAARSVRNEHDLHPSATVPLFLRTADDAVRATLAAQSGLIQFLVRTSGAPELLASGSERPQGAVVHVAGAVEVFVVLRGVVDPAKEEERIARVRKKLLKDKSNLEQRLNNPKFLEKAPPEVVAEVRDQLTAVCRQLDQLDVAHDLIQELE